MSHYTLAHLEEAPRNELHDLLHLTAAEISRNTLPAGVSVPFVHRHRKNEEIYLVLDGRGTLYIDGEELPLRAGDCFRIDPAGARCLRAADDSPLSFTACRPGPAAWKASPGRMACLSRRRKESPAGCSRMPGTGDARLRRRAAGAGHPARRNVRRCPAGGRGVSSAGYSFFTSTYQAAACSSRWLLRPASIWASRR